jgi:large subunit ribosomal protein L22
MANIQLPAHELPSHAKPGLEGSVNAGRALGLPGAARAFQRSTRQSPYKVRLVIDQIRGLGVNEALAVLKFSKKHASDEIAKVLSSAVANAEDAARRSGGSADVDALYVAHAVVNEGRKLKRFTPAAMGRATPVHKRTSHIEIVVAERPAKRAAGANASGVQTSAVKKGER